MKKAILNALKIGFLFAASIAGAGFASGKEIMEFFTRFENFGAVGLGFCAVMLGLFGYIGLKISTKLRIVSLNELLEVFLGKYAFLFQLIIKTFMFVVFSVMICGAGELIRDNTGLNYYVSTFLFLVLIMWMSGKDNVFMQKISVILMGILFISIIIFSVLINLKRSSDGSVAVFLNICDNGGIYSAMWEALTYCGYNSLLAVSSIVSISKCVKNNRIDIVGGSIAGAVIFILPAFIMNDAMVSFVSVLKTEDFPFIFLIEMASKNLAMLYSFIVFLAMTLCAMINGHYLRKMNYFIPLSGYSSVFTGFSEIIKRLYPVYGAFGILFLIILIIRYCMIYFDSDLILSDDRPRGV